RRPRAFRGGHPLLLGDEGALGPHLRPQRERRSRCHRGARPDHADPHFGGDRRGKPRPGPRRPAAREALLMDGERPVAEALAERIASLDAARLPPAVRETCERLLIDVIGLCLVARRTDYVRAALSAWSSDPGPATAIGHPGQVGAAEADLVNGTAANGEAFDDTVEGGHVL